MADKKRIIIAGGGRIGLRTAEELDARGHDVVLIEKDADRVADVGEEYVAMVLEGDATNPSVLEQAEPERADTIAGLTDNPGTNLAICLEAKRMAPEIETLARTDTGTAEDYDKIVDATILPYDLTADTAADFLSGGEVQTLVADHHDLEILEIEIDEDSAVAGRQLADISLPTGALVISDHDRSRIASGETTLEPGERYIVGVERDVVDEVLGLFRG